MVEFDYEQYHAHRLKGAGSQKLMTFFIDELSYQSVEAFRCKSPIAAASILESDANFVRFLNSITSQLSNEDNQSLARQILNHVARRLLQNRPSERSDYQMSGDDIMFLLERAPQLNHEIRFVKSVGLNFSNLSEMSKYLSHDGSNDLHPIVTSHKTWTQEQLTKMFAAGALLDFGRGHALDYTNLDVSILANPILAGVNRELSAFDAISTPEATKLDEIKTGVYKNNQFFRIVEAISGRYFSFLNRPADDNTCEAFDSLCNAATRIDFFTLSNGGTVKSIHLESMLMAILNTRSIHEVAEILDQQLTHNGAYFEKFDEFKSSGESVDTLIESILFDAQVYLASAKKVDEIASSICGTKEACDFLTVFSRIMSFFFVADGEEIDSYKEKGPFQEAFIDYPFNGVNKLVLMVFSELGKFRNIPKTALMENEESKIEQLIFNFICNCPIPLLCKILKEISDDETFIGAMEYLQIRIGGSEFMRSIHGADLKGQALANLYAEAESRIPGFGKTFSLTELVRGCNVDRNKILSDYQRLVNAEKDQSLNNGINQGAADMGFLTSGMKI